MQEKTVRSGDADIKYWWFGNGPLLILIAGGGGVGVRFFPVMEKLSSEYTVATYDRRCCSGSTGDDEDNFMPFQQARDALAVMKATGFEKSSFFGCSAGGIVGLELAARFPQHCEDVIVHEAPTFCLIEQHEKVLNYIYAVERKFRHKGQAAASKMLHFRHKGVLDDDPEWVWKTTQIKEETGDMKGIPNGDYFFGREYLLSCVWTPDLQRIRDNHVSIASCAGEQSKKIPDPGWLAAIRQSQLIGCPFIEFPGHHLVHLFDYSEVLLSSLRSLRQLREAKHLTRSKPRYVERVSMP